MTTPTDSLAGLERRAWRSTFDDGLFDLLLGTMLLLNGFGSVVPNSRLLYPFYFVLIGVFWVLKWRVVLPRAGAARFAPARRQRKALAALVLLVATMVGGGATTVMVVGGGAAEWLKANPVVFEAGVPALVIAVFSALALLLDVTRIHLIGLAAAVGFGIDLWRGSGAGFLAGGALVSIVGLVLLTGFLRSHPRPDAGDRERADAR